MKRFLFGVILTVLIFGVVQYCTRKNNELGQVQADSKLIVNQIEHVGKLVVTEGQFAEVISYNGDKKYFFDFVSIEKNALIIVNADATVSYDLRQIKYELKPDQKKVVITYIPKPEVKIYPNLKYYDVRQSQFNQFTSRDFNHIQRKVYDDLKKKINRSPLLKNARHQLLSELSKIWILTSSMGWKLEYNEQPITDESDWDVPNKFENIEFKN